MCDKCEKSIDIEQEEFANEQECQEVEVGDILSSDERFIELEIEKELNRIDKEIIYDDESLAEVINSDNFKKGCNDASYLCGYYTSLINCGMSSKIAEEMVINIQTCNHNKSLQELINKNQLEVAQVQSVTIEKQQV